MATSKLVLVQTSLETICPPDGNGYYCYWATKDGKIYQNFTPTVAKLAHHIIRLDDLGCETYHAVNTFVNPTAGRTQVNVQAICSLWGDIDVDPNDPKKYASQADGYRAAIGFCRDNGFPDFSFVNSGYGLHSYWFLGAILNLEEWLPYAEGFKTLAEQKGFKLDPARTADASSILRTPGTHNHKHGKEVLVEWDNKTDHHPISAFASLYTHVPKLVKPRTNQISEKGAADNKAALPFDRPSSDDIANECKILSKMRETKGKDQGYKLWYNSLGVLEKTKDGAEKAHEWSSGHPDYTHAETQEHLDHWKNYGPTLCSTLRQYDSASCDGCRHNTRINSPINALKDDVEKNKDEDPEHVNGFVFDFGKLPTVGENFSFNKNGSLVINVEKNKHDVPVVISQYPIYLEKIANAENVGEKVEQHYVFHHWRPQEKWDTITIAAHDYVGPSGAQKMLSQGSNIRDWQNFKKAVAVMVDNYNYDNKAGVHYNKFGWKEDGSFLSGTRLYRQGEVINVKLDANLLHRASHLKPVTGGNRAAWSNSASKMFQKGLEPIGFTLVCGFAALLMRFVSENEGGAIVHLVSGQSARGKTLTLEMMTSIWGQWPGLRMTSDDTRISKALILGTLSHYPVPWDELTTFDPPTITKLVQTFTDGTDKARARRDGTLYESGLNWQTLLISASNRYLRELLTDRGSASNAMSLRILELPLDFEETYTMLEMEAFKKTMLENAGHAGHKYLTYITHDKVLKGYIPDALAYRMRELVDNYEFTRDHRFYIRTLAAVWVAGEMVNGLGLMEFDIEYLIEWAVDVLKPPKMIERRDKGYKAPAMTLLARFLNENIRGTLVMNHAGAGGMAVEKPTADLIIRKEQREKKIYISTTAFRKWLIKQDMPVAETANELAKHGIFRQSMPHINLGMGTYYGGAREDVWEIQTDTAAFSGVEQELKDNVVQLKK